MADAETPPLSRRTRTLKVLSGTRVGMAFLGVALLFLVFTVSYALNVIQSRHADSVAAKATNVREARADKRYDEIVKNQNEIIRQLNALQRKECKVLR